MKIKIDEFGRIIIPKNIRELFNIGDELYLSVNSNKELILSVEKRKTAQEVINRRLKKADITQSERSFLNTLKTYI